MKKDGVFGESQQKYKVLYIKVLVVLVFAMVELKTKLLRRVLSNFNFTLLEKYSTK